MLLWWANRSLPPSSGVMNPKPFSSLNHLTVPLGIVCPGPSVLGGAAPSHATGTTGRAGPDADNTNPAAAPDASADERAGSAQIEIHRVRRVGRQIAAADRGAAAAHVVHRLGAEAHTDELARERLARE